MIVDDEEIDLNILNLILEPEYTIYTAKSGQAGFKCAHDVDPDIIILDILMPDMNGFDVLYKLKESDVTRSIPVIFITALDGVEDEKKDFPLDL